MTQKEFLSNFLKKHKQDIIIASLGSISNNIDDLGDNPNVIQIRGAMGCAIAAGLGYALASDRKVYALIGDGALLMKLGSLALFAKHKPKNLKIIVLNNNCHASCGGQATNFRYIKNRLKGIVQINEVCS